MTTTRQRQKAIERRVNALGHDLRTLRRGGVSVVRLIEGTELTSNIVTRLLNFGYRTPAKYEEQLDAIEPLITAALKRVGEAALDLRAEAP